MHKDSILVILVYSIAIITLAFSNMLGIPFTYSGPIDIHPNTAVTDWIFWVGVSVIAAGFLFIRFCHDPRRRYIVARVLIWSLRFWMLLITVLFFIDAYSAANHWLAMYFRGQGTGWILVAVFIETGSFYTRKRLA